MLPGILSHLGPEGVNQLKRLAFANSLSGAQRGIDDDIPDLIQNFESQSLSDEVNVDEAIEAGVRAGPAEIVD